MNKHFVATGLAAVFGAILFAGAANAVILDQVSYTIGTPTSVVGNAPGIGDNLSNPLTLTVGTPISETPFFNTNPSGSCGIGCVNSTASEKIPVTFSFTGLTPVAGSTLTETATYEAKYGGTELPCSTSGTGNSDCLLWGSTTSGTATITDTIVFTNGDSLLITLYNAQDWDITTQISFNLTAPAATPLPPALSLFAGGLGLFGFLGARRKQKAAAIAA